ncbi:protein phosphatase 2C domain protein [Teredinibacter turnerae T7901]|uniref:Protein phosphatase 2C domain protein n=1 Tax=Teredinibacter turnerae (strain ATCC 39867 / T7901) TaxID=377629 RepID=C5BKX9_TERTT|nr:protein phosphatase 2C domain-containing protein [Teredinibacter turnerae]ACR10715.1 protein phosphatase 2C domain protein [Teredinibacter turnerae T7901]
MFLTEYCAVTDVGLQRNNNEDCHISLPLQGLWVVADGMGGHAAGEVASSIACNTLREAFLGGASLADAVQTSHKAILDAADAGVGGAGMGSTVVALASSQDRFQLAWVGDSRAYLFTTSSETPFRQLTKDHSYVQMLLDSGAITPEEFTTHPEKNIITQCLGALDLPEVNVGLFDAQWQPGDWLLLCSDGLTDAVSDDDIAASLKQANSVAAATAALLEAALKNGGRDNITIQLIQAPNKLQQRFQQLAGSISRNLR